MRFLAALRLLTIIPFPFWRNVSQEDLGHATGYFPVVGIIIGLGLAGLNWFLALFLPMTIVNGLLLIYLVVISGGLHIDGFIDTCDGMAGHKTVAERWRIMHDSRAGAFGIVGAFLLLLVKYVSLNSLPEHLLTIILVMMPIVSRWAMVYAVCAYPYARPEGLGKVFKQGAGWSSFILATLVTLAAVIGLAQLAHISYMVGLAIMLVTWLMVVAGAGYLQRKFAGLTGDTYGAINEMSEVWVLILVVLLAYHRWLGLA
ncbi:MAG: cobalamin synthase [Dehalococcoidales bacterium]|nr:cobalamin synthase [Dehalococcoidales bacterium]